MDRGRLGGESQRRRWLSVIFPFSPLLRRVIVVARSHPVLATGPCWHSSFPASRDGIAAQLGGTGPVPRLPLAERGGGSP